jgi:hypothetical protein
MLTPIKVAYQSTSSVYQANQWLQSLPALIACDFEAAVKYTPEQIEQFKQQLEQATTNRQRIQLLSKIEATALDHPSHVDLTHLQIAISPSEAYVFILDNKPLRERVLTFLTTTTARQIWHNASFDFKHIHYHTGKFPIEYEDTALLAKSILNHRWPNLAKVGLKDLAGKWYGNWAISPDNFTKDQMYDSTVLLYAATDACATYRLWQSLKDYCKSQLKEEQP